MDCSKKRYLTRSIAKEALKRANKESRSLYSKLTNVYQCDECGYWHMTSIPKKKSRAISRHGKNTNNNK